MPVISDCHVHTSFSADCEAPMEQMVLSAIQRGIQTLCFTEHYDEDSPFINDPEGERLRFVFDFDVYYEELQRMREKYKDRIRLLCGAEIGMHPACRDRILRFADRYHDKFDFLIGSTHAADGLDPYYPSYFEGRSLEDSYRAYYRASLLNVRTFDFFDSYAHLDYVLRYAPLNAVPQHPRAYWNTLFEDEIREILDILIERGQSLELNTQALFRGFPDANPDRTVLDLYGKEGGTRVTVGSDAQVPACVGAGFDRARATLLNVGIRCVTVYERRVPRTYAI